MPPALAPTYGIGLMSGTSLDAIDGLCVAMTRNTGIADGCAGSLSTAVVDSASIPLPRALKEALLEVQASQSVTFSQFAALQSQWTQLAIAVASQLQHQCPEPIAVIGCHGQTVYHQPPDTNAEQQPGFSWQWGNAAQLAAACGVPVVSDFRNGDMALGGQGAPLVPFVQALLWGHLKPKPAFLNLGGIANLTLLPATPPMESPVWDWPDVQGFDTGPANMLMDRAMQRWGNAPYDANGALAQRGTVYLEALTWALAHPYFKQPPPKSTGRECFGDVFLDELVSRMALPKPFSQAAVADILATLVALTAQSVALAWPEGTPNLPSTLWVSGGGAHNPALMAALGQALASRSVSVEPVCVNSPLCVGPTQMEALAFAVLAWCRLRGWPAQCASATGASKATPLGALVLPPR